MNATLGVMKTLPDYVPAIFKNGAAVLALKRSGDWGMVQHCRRYGMVFVTTDRFAALYAAYRGVCVIHLMVAQVRIPKYDGRLKKEDQRPAKAEFVQYSFSMFSTDAAVARLRFHPEPEVQVGGAVTRVTNFALIGLTIAMAVMGSIAMA